LVENPNVKFTDIIGLDDAKRLIKEAVMLPLKYPDYFTGILEPWRGVLLFGPPGTGKVFFILFSDHACQICCYSMQNHILQHLSLVSCFEVARRK
jgi:katanin p60 ATPase-containing subunit A1